MTFKHHTPSSRASKRRPASRYDRAEAEADIANAIAHLKTARAFLKRADAPLACGKVRDALKSAEGAYRNASVKASRLAREEVAIYSRQNAAEQECVNVYRARKPLTEKVEDGKRVRYDSQGTRRVMGDA